MKFIRDRLRRQDAARNVGRGGALLIFVIVPIVLERWLILPFTGVEVDGLALVTNVALAGISAWLTPAPLRAIRGVIHRCDGQAGPVDPEWRIFVTVFLAGLFLFGLLLSALFPVGPWAFTWGSARSLVGLGVASILLGLLFRSAVEELAAFGVPRWMPWILAPAVGLLMVVIHRLPAEGQPWIVDISAILYGVLLWLTVQI